MAKAETDVPQTKGTQSTSAATPRGASEGDKKGRGEVRTPPFSPRSWTEKELADAVATWPFSPTGAFAAGVLHGVDISARRPEFVRVAVAMRGLQVANADYDFASDHYLCPERLEDQEVILLKFLLAEEFHVEKAVERLRKTLHWRKRWNPMAWHAPGKGREILEAAGASTYFVDSGEVDKEAAPYLVGRLSLCKKDKALHPWNHLIGAIYIVEMMSTSVRYPVTQGAYILDLQDAKSTGKESAAGIPDNSHIPPCMFEEWGDITPGLSVLKAAIGTITEHYPETLKKVFLWKSAFWFRALFKVFSMWMHKRTQQKVFFVGNGWGDHPPQRVLDFFNNQTLAQDFGGQGAPMGKDDFVRRAISRYDEEE